jgi:hypothetical protein
MPSPSSHTRPSISVSSVPLWLTHLRSLWDRLENPVLGREFRSRMRGARSYWITGSYTLVVGVFVLIAYWLLAAEQHGRSMNQAAAEVGRGIWLWGSVTQAVLLPLIVPAFTSGAITLERERDLLEMLLLTRQSPFQICLGKLTSGVGLGLMLVLSSVPVLSISLLLGGIAPGEILATLSILVSSVIAAGALGLAASSMMRKTAAAVAAYLIMGFAMVGIPVLMAFLDFANTLSRSGSEAGILVMLAACVTLAFPPALGLAAAICGIRRARTGTPPDRSGWMLTTGLCWAALLLFLYLPGVPEILLQGQSVLLLHPVAAILGVMYPQSSSMNPLMPDIWIVSTLAYLGAASWFFYIAVLRVRRLRSGL